MRGILITKEISMSIIFTHRRMRMLLTSYSREHSVHHKCKNDFKAMANLYNQAEVLSWTHKLVLVSTTNNSTINSQMMKTNNKSLTRSILSVLLCIRTMVLSSSPKTEDLQWIKEVTIMASQIKEWHQAITD